MSFDIKTTEEDMKKVIVNLHNELDKFRTGRANPNMLDSVKPLAYGNPSPLCQVAMVNVVDARQLMVKPFDKSLLGDIDKAIQAADLGINPINDGEVIRINIPSLTEETRKLLVKDCKSCGEDHKVRIRNIRQDAMTTVKKDKELTDDMKKSSETQVQELVVKYNKEVETVIKNKEQEVMTI